MNWTAISVFIVFFLLVTVMGFYAAKWRRGDLDQLHEWGLGGRRFGTVVTWFLLGGDLYTAYTFIAVPAVLYAQGAMGFFAVPYTIMIYPILFLVFPRLWAVSRKNGYITASDFVRGRFDSKSLALAVALTGILATLPYIALQLVGMQAVLGAMGLTGDWPILIAFAILAVYTYSSGLRAPALIAVVKDLMIYITVIAAVIVVPMKLGGFGNIFHAAQAALPKTFVPAPSAYLPYATLALGSALALFLYPHSVTGTLSSSSQKVIKRNAALLPAYSLMLAFLTLIGFMAIAAGVQTKVSSLAVPLLIVKVFPDWFIGFAFAAIAIGALVPAAIMSIAAANLFTRNIYKEYINPYCTHQQEARMAKLTSLIVKIGALIFVVGLPSDFAINLQLLGGVWILQTFPSVVIGLFNRWFHRYALTLGWLAGMIVGTSMAIANQFKSSVFALHIGGNTYAAYAAVWALTANFIIAIVFTWIFNAFNVNKGVDQTAPQDYS